jgi:transcriptional regulator with XRE-family HTH domain
MEGSLAQRLRILRARKGLTLTQAGEKMGITRHTLGALERGGQEPHFDTLHKIAAFYGVPVEELLAKPVPFDEALEEAGPSAQVVDGGGIQSSAVGGGFIYRLPTEKEWAEFVRELEDLQHDIAAGEKSKGVAWDTVVGTMDSFKRKL